ncbi:MAG TPA: cysteine synthase family protein [Limnochordia bacterium]|nr:cysteine synthase family protein [Limnochordia bacterium]
MCHTFCTAAAADERDADTLWSRLSAGAPLLRRIGNTPLLDLSALSPKREVQIMAKAEWFNPGGSVKDRPALRMIRSALERGALTPDRVLLDSTSGNTGIAYAMIGAALGFRVELCLPKNASLERQRLIAAYGTTIHFTDPLEGSEGARVVAQQRYEASPDRYYMPDQYNNAANPEAHYETTGPEIWRQTDGRVTHFVAGIGTGGTLMGTGRFLKEANPDLEMWAVEPDDPLHGLEGMKHMATAMVPGIYDESRLDGKLSASTEVGYDMVGYMARRQGILIGASGGAALWGAIELARRIERGLIVTILPDSGSRYLSTQLWDLVLSGEQSS